MSILEIIFGILILVISILIIIVVLFQEGKQHTSGVITGGGANTFLNNNKSRSVDSLLTRWTKFIAVIFFLLVILFNAITFFKLFGIW
ncbi:MAG: preprotein translocase subunit SecG [Candidatus Paraimprobicoccus trichonymphae]|uniref:Protein-export membrane protein SecG n=1 Tax=Candidatus Paraimprobicoccus trichonymphae TaxID=3033793 RepID=A0AA48I3G3_9FIRM|nr:MAG: preprotein translocase subunit SecG [Candidatus Paraimprobicoccus trichonymphae]